MLSGATVLQNATTTQNGYGCDLDKLEEGSRLGVMRKSDGSLHFFINKQDCGVAASNVPSGKFTLSSLSSTKNNIDLGVEGFTAFKQSRMKKGTKLSLKARVLDKCVNYLCP